MEARNVICWQCANSNQWSGDMRGRLRYIGWSCLVFFYDAYGAFYIHSLNLPLHYLMCTSVLRSQNWKKCGNMESWSITYNWTWPVIINCNWAMSSLIELVESWLQSQACWYCNYIHEVYQTLLYSVIDMCTNGLRLLITSDIMYTINVHIFVYCYYSNIIQFSMCGFILMLECVGSASPEQLAYIDRAPNHLPIHENHLEISV